MATGAQGSGQNASIEGVFRDGSVPDEGFGKSCRSTNIDCFLSDGGASSHVSDNGCLRDVAPADEGFGTPGGTNDTRHIFELDPDSATAKGFAATDKGLLGEDGEAAQRSAFSVAVCCCLSSTNSSWLHSIFARSC
jgi:hypothetical protein